ncbi:MAG: prephenate dehydrogenase/arogenate dehydrogenase family protein [Verrucomicrobiae bacterium]|nr:prephenate dehydrogenase/arogenate dehydrogenase family protein [Verrucomicrobiae bacterium]
MLWRKAAILGVGLLGGSLGLALRRRGLAGEVTGLVRRTETVAAAVRMGAVDQASQCLETVVAGADLVVFCTPLGQMEGLGERLNGVLEAGAVVTDVGSAKAGVVASLEPRVLAAGGRFVGSHPMAGSERTGVEASREDLFEGAVSVVTPTEASDAEAVLRVNALWESVGARVLTMDAGRHDALVSRSSHLPHLVASALVDCVLGNGADEEQGLLCATGFRDTTRVALGSPEMWRDIGLANRRALLEALDRFERSVGGLRQALAAGDAEGLGEALRGIRERREEWGRGFSKGGGE